MRTKNLGFIIETFNTGSQTWNQLDSSNRFTTRKAAGVSAKQRCTDTPWRVTPLTEQAK